MSQVEEVHYLSKDQALQNFKEKHKDDQKILDSLQEIDKNPLGASLIVTAKKTSDYPIILENLKNTQFNDMIESKDFDDHQLVIERITSITQKVSKGVIIIAAIFALISLLIIFNAIRIAIYTHRDEILAMKLIGATDWFVETPFLLQGIIFAFISVIATIIIVYPLLGFLQPYLKIILENNFNIIYYFNSNFLLIFSLEFLGAVLLNLISSYIAVKRYVRV
jgi:cell division transport system permease protein